MTQQQGGGSPTYDGLKLVLWITLRSADRASPIGARRMIGKSCCVRTSVLVVDDAASFLESAASLIQWRGFEVAGQAASAEEALAAARDLRPDAILLDVHLPDMSGLEVARELVSANDGLRVLLTSSDPDATNEALAAEAGAVGFVAKDELVSTDLHRYFSS
jgi:DNA-binding NarL/FixJ family response regulator